MTDTIAAIATGNTVSAIGIIRISGSNAIVAANSIFRAANGISLLDAENRHMYYGEILDSSSTSAPHSHHTTIDFCLCMISRAPASYTGEDTVELHCHGSPVVLSEVMRLLFTQGVRQALPGEFTKRAFLNGRMDLTQAEAVIDIIEAETPAASRNAAGQLRGAIGLKMDSVYNKLTDIIAHFHAVIDYPDEDIDEFNIQNYLSILYGIDDELGRMLETHKRSKVLRDGVPTAIIGRPNTGKSSLLNALLGYDRAIVTDIAGTTRDTIEEKVLIGNILLRLIDTAGLRETSDEVEILGIDRSLTAINAAGLVILVLDGSEPLTKEDIDALDSIPTNIPKIAVINKSDLPTALNQNKIAELNIEFCTISALHGKGLNILSEKIVDIFPEFNASPTGELITNTRQAEAISVALASIRSASTALIDAITPDVILIDIEAAMNAIGEVTGKNMCEDIISRIFERFCVGK
ncbi:MAG: tRNA uridine-5-carboxymethylaminomethyl(34) synthesis GTPase MnmE [Oscillospiraceae bacterium]|nr:tRNA uridine-5-carboxymethylaminomethyl(34) synthesis GTPase MnmE [Oscillospiraceae bacterium]